MTTKTTYYCWHTSPVGELLLAGDDDALTHISFPIRDLSNGKTGNGKTGKGKTGNGNTAGGKFSPMPHWLHDDSAFTHTRSQLDQYFARELIDFDLSLKPHGTVFQQQVWQALRAIPYGETVSYGAIADSIDRPKAVRAVGNANGRNPIPIVIPCHRVIGKDGTLTGFGGGLPVKHFLLDLENREQLTLAF